MKQTVQVFGMVVVNVFLTGCASMILPKSIPLTRAFSPGEQIAGVYREPRSMERMTLGNVVGGTVVAGGLGAQYAMKSGGSDMQDRLSLPEFGYLVLCELSSLASAQVSNWPATTIGTSPVPKTQDIKGPALEVVPMAIGVVYFGPYKGLDAKITARIVDANGLVVWQKGVWYRSKHHGRGQNVDQYEKNGGALLKEELSFAAKVVAKEMVTALKKPQ